MLNDISGCNQPNLEWTSSTRQPTRFFQTNKQQGLVVGGRVEGVRMEVEKKKEEWLQTQISDPHQLKGIHRSGLGSHSNQPIRSGLHFRKL